MRLWHQVLIPHLPRQQLLGQHRECCALRGKGWGRKHKTVDYVFTHPMEWLISYHYKVMLEMDKRGYTCDIFWVYPNYRGKNCSLFHPDRKQFFHGGIIYPEHNEEYLQGCLQNLAQKGVHISIGGK